MSYESVDKLQKLLAEDVFSYTTDRKKAAGKASTDFAGRSVHSQSHHWCTPPQYVAAVKRVFGGEIGLDPCSNHESVVNAKCEFMLPETDGLAEEWNFPSIYVNPPYGADRARGERRSATGSPNALLRERSTDLRSSRSFLSRQIHRTGRNTFSVWRTQSASYTIRVFVFL